LVNLMIHQGGADIANFTALYKFLSFNIFFDNWLKSKKREDNLHSTILAYFIC